MKLTQHNEYLSSGVGTDGLVFWHQGINTHCAEYAPMSFYLFMG